MLVLARKKGESVILQDGNGEIIEVTFLERRGMVVRLGFTAPRHIKVDRKEIFEKKKSEGTIQKGAT